MFPGDSRDSTLECDSVREHESQDEKPPLSRVSDRRDRHPQEASHIGDGMAIEVLELDDGALGERQRGDDAAEICLDLAFLERSRTIEALSLSLSLSLTLSPRRRRTGALRATFAISCCMTRTIQPATSSIVFSRRTASSSHRTIASWRRSRALTCRLTPRSRTSPAAISTRRRYPSPSF